MSMCGCVGVYISNVNTFLFTYACLVFQEAIFTDRMEMYSKLYNSNEIIIKPHDDARETKHTVSDTHTHTLASVNWITLGYALSYSFLQ